MLKRAVLSIFHFLGYNIHSLPGKRRKYKGLPDGAFYTPLFSPWNGFGDFFDYYLPAQPYTLVSPDRCYILLSFARQSCRLPGCWIECGVYKGGTAMMLAKAMQNLACNNTLHLFDTFQGLPQIDSTMDLHHKGDFADTAFEDVKTRIHSITEISKQSVVFHPGLIPETFSTASMDRISLAHVDVDLYQSVLDCCEFIYPRLVAGGILLFDDYGFPSCPGARAAVDQFFHGKPETPVVLPTGQALIIKLFKTDG